MSSTGPGITTLSRARAGMTLIELLVVMGLLGLLLGTGVGMIASLNLGERAAVGTVQNVMRSARNAAVARNSPARVRIDLVAGTMTAEAMEVIGTWHFEQEALHGAFQIQGVNVGATLIDDGFIGSALSFTGKRGAHASFPVERLASYDLAEGFAIDVAARLEDAGGGRMINVGGVAGIDVTGAGALKGWFVPRVIDSTGRPTAGGAIKVESLPGALPMKTWNRLRLEYDRTRLRLLVDDVEVAGSPETLEVWALEGDLVLSDRQVGFQGSLDNLVISAVTASETFELPDTTRFSPETPGEIRFDAGGHLDRSFHSEPVEFSILFEDGKSAFLRVGLYGTVE